MPPAALRARGIICIEVVADIVRKPGARYAQRGSLRAAGRLGFFPARRSSRWRRISAQGMVFPEATMPA
jgi:hypothetical protein